MSQVICNEVHVLSNTFFYILNSLLNSRNKGQILGFHKSNSLCKQKKLKSLSELKKKNKLPSRKLEQTNWVNYLLWIIHFSLILSLPIIDP